MGEELRQIAKLFDHLDEQIQHIARCQEVENVGKCIAFSQMASEFIRITKKLEIFSAA